MRHVGHKVKRIPYETEASLIAYIGNQPCLEHCLICETQKALYGGDLLSSIDRTISGVIARMGRRA
jgi:hypothetical protein